MKPLMLNGHERSLTQIKYNRDGDLLFSVSKDKKPNVWYSSNGERLGTFNGHNGTCWCIDVNEGSDRMMSGSADNTARIWDVSCGKEVTQIGTDTAVRTCGFAHFSGAQVFYTTDERMGKPCEIVVRDLLAPEGASDVRRITMEPKNKVTAAVWGPLNEFIVTGHEDGSLKQWDLKTGQMSKSVSEHTGAIQDLQLSHDLTMLISSSKDTTAKLFDTRTLDHMKTYKTDRPVNSASISPIKEHIVLGGGQEAMNVTTTSTRVGKFDARFYHLVFEEEIGRVKGHFGPINTIAFHPDGRSYASGAEDGYVRVHNFDASYYEFEFLH